MNCDHIFASDIYIFKLTNINKSIFKGPVPDRLQLLYTFYKVGLNDQNINPIEENWPSFTQNLCISCVIYKYIY